MTQPLFDVSLVQDIAAPQEFVFAQLADFDDLEQQLRRTGAAVQRRGDDPGADLSWCVGFAYRGARREMIVTLADYTPPERMRLVLHSVEATGAIDVAVSARGAGAARLSVAGGLDPATLPARLVLQSLRLGQRRIDANLQGRLRRFGARIAQRWQSG